jgi:hypothetical protein
LAVKSKSKAGRRILPAEERSDPAKQMALSSNG